MFFTNVYYTTDANISAIKHSCAQQLKLNSVKSGLSPQKLQNVAYQGSTTNTHIALNYLLTSDLLAAARPESQTVVILVTDGLSTVPDQSMLFFVERKCL